MRVLAVAAHPDDETLGAGGTLLRHKERGDDIFWLITTAPVGDGWSESWRNSRDNEVAAASKAYGFTDVFDLRYPGAALETVPQRELIDRIWSVLENVNPDRVYTVGDTDVHTDHSLTFQALMLALKPFRPQFKVDGIYAYEVLSSTEAALGWRPNPFIPNVYSDITQYLDRKLEIMALFGDQVQPPPMPRSLASIRALAQYRGTTIGVGAGEAFRLVRGLLV